MPNMVKWKGKKCEGNMSQIQMCEKGQQWTQNIQNVDNVAEMNGNNEYALRMSGSHLDGHETNGTWWQLPRNWGKSLCSTIGILELLHRARVRSRVWMTTGTGTMAALMLLSMVSIRSLQERALAGAICVPSITCQQMSNSCKNNDQHAC